MTIVCAACGQETQEALTCSSCSEPPYLEDRYRLDRILGHGGEGVTYQATRLSDQRVVCVKELQFHRLKSLDTERLFQREAKVLRQLDHPQIPAYVDDFVVESGKTLSLYLVQDFVAGEDLAAESTKRRYSDLEVLEIGAELAEVLVYLQTLRPIVVHRDIKPSNIVRSSESGALVLVDFGAVRRLVADSLGAGATVAGTYGYMAPEQFAGDATEQTDLYGLGATLLALLTGQAPEAFMDDGHRLNWTSEVESPQLLGVLKTLLAPDPKDRPKDAADALTGLHRAILDVTQPPRVARVEAKAPPVVVERPLPPTPATTKQPMSRPAMLSVGAAFFVVAAVVWVGARAPMSRRTPSQAKAAQTQSHSDASEARVAVSVPFHDPVRFGMNQWQVIEASDEFRAFDEIARAKRHLRSARMPEGLPPELASALRRSQRLNGAMRSFTESFDDATLEARLPIGDQQAKCVALVEHTHGLGELVCRLNLQGQEEQQQRLLRDRFVETMHKRYGPPDFSPTATAPRGTDWVEEFVWESPGGRLSVTLSGGPTYGERLDVVHTSGALIKRRIAERVESTGHLLDKLQ